MANNLDGLALPDLHLSGEFSRASVTAVSATARDGSAVVWEGPLSGRPLDLVGAVDGPWVDRSWLIILRAMADVPGAVYDLEWAGVTYRVRFRNEDGAIEAVPVLDGLSDPDDVTLYTSLVIRLMEV